MVAPLARADPTQTDLHLADIGLPGIDELDGVARAAAVLDIDVELASLNQPFCLRQMHRRLHAPRREIEPHRQFVLVPPGQREPAGGRDNTRSIRVDRNILLMSQSPV